MIDNFFHERQLWERGYRQVAGIDEVGRGCLCGPVLAAAVVFPGPVLIPGLDDSKRLTAKERERLVPLIYQLANSVTLGAASSHEIDRLNILQATRLAMKRAVSRLQPQPDALLIDAVVLPSISTLQRNLVRGDQLSASISAASVIAKVVRDRLMRQYHQVHPGYGIDRNKGYPTSEHKAAIRSLGLTPCHRRTFQGVKEWVCPPSGQPLGAQGEISSDGLPLFSGST